MIYKLYRAVSVKDDGTKIPVEEFNYEEVMLLGSIRFCFEDKAEAEKARLAFQAQDAVGYYKIEKHSKRK